MRPIGLVLLWFGLLGLAGSFAFPVAASYGGTDSVVNMDALALRSMLSNSAGFAAIVGAILACLSPTPATENAARDVPSGVPAE